MEVELYRRYKSLRKVSALTKIPVSTLWYRLSKKGVLQKKKIVLSFKNNHLLVGTYIGLWAGDGSRYYDKGYITKIHLNKQDLLLAKFIIELIWKLFNKTVRVYIDGKNDNRASIKIHSKFIYDFAGRYLHFSRWKSKTVYLKRGQNLDFLEGFLLGLTISDGYLKEKFVYASISDELAAQVMLFLQNYGFSPKQYIHKRQEQGWNDLCLVRLTRKESVLFKHRLDSSLGKIDAKYSIDALKRYIKEKNGPAEI